MRHTLGLTIAATLLALWPATSAKAQFSYGRDSYIYGGYQPSMSYYNAYGYNQMYTNPANGIYTAGTTLPPQVAAPYTQPPYGSFTPGSGLPTVYSQPAQVVPRSVVTPAPVVRVRRPLARRRFAR